MVDQKYHEGRGSSRAIRKKSPSSLPRPKEVVSNIITAAVSIFFMNILWSHRLINDNCHQPLLQVQLHDDENKGINLNKETKNTTAPSPYIKHCPNSAIRPITDGKYPLPLFTSSNSPIFLRLPTQLLKSYVGIEPGTLLEEKKTISRLHLNKNNPGWNIISDNDESCFRKIEQIDIFQLPHVKNWFFSKVTMNNQKSDLCTLAQLFLDGGVYVDESKSVTSVFRDIIEGVDVLFYVTIDPGNRGSLMSHSILGAPRVIRPSNDSSCTGNCVQRSVQGDGIDVPFRFIHCRCIDKRHESYLQRNERQPTKHDMPRSPLWGNDEWSEQRNK